MARPLKSGLLYFPLDCQLDDKMELIEAEFGLKGFAVIIKLWQRIYADNGYYCEWNSEVALVFSKRIGLGADVVSEIIQAALKRGIFNREMYDKYNILTSAGIQKRYAEATSRCKKSIDEQYLLLKCAQNTVSAAKTEVSATETTVFADNNSTKESKVNKSKSNQSKTDVPATSLPSPALSDNRKRLADKFGEENVALYERKFDNWAAKQGGVKADKLLTIEKWLIKDGVKPLQKNSVPSDWSEDNPYEDWS